MAKVNSPCFKIHPSHFFHVIQFDNCWVLNFKGLYLSLKEEFFLKIVICCSLPVEKCTQNRAVRAKLLFC